MFPVKHTVIYTFFAITSVQNTCFCSVSMLWHPTTLQNLAMHNVFFIFGRFSIAGKLPKWPKIPFQYPLALRHPKILEKCRKHHRILVSVRNRFWAPPAKADIATAILTNVIEHLVLLLPPNKHAFTAKAVWADFHRSKLHFVCQRNVKVHKTPTLFVLRSSLHVASQMSIGHSWCPSQKLDTWTGPSCTKLEETWGNLRKPEETWGNLRKPEETWGNLRKPEETWGNLRKPVTLKLSKLIQDVVEMVVFDLVSDRFVSKNSSWDAKNSGARRAWDLGVWGCFEAGRFPLKL